MIFIDKLKDRDLVFGPEFDRLFKLALQNQKDPGDLLLLYCNGFFDKNILDYNSRAEEKLNPHLLGPGREGLSDYTHYAFINKYRQTNIVGETYAEYLKKHEYTPERSDEIDLLVDYEETTIQLEMLIYLKIWEADMVLKKFYEFAKILCGEPYDWYVKIDSRPKFIRRNIMSKLKDISPLLYDLIDKTYIPQIRNSIAHSNYSFQGRSIHLNNDIPGKKNAQLKAISFDDWVDIFHNTIVIHNEYIKLNNRINEYYVGLTEKHNKVNILVTEKNKNQYYYTVIYRPEWKDWVYV